MVSGMFPQIPVEPKGECGSSQERGRALDESVVPVRNVAGA